MSMNTVRQGLSEFKEKREATLTIEQEIQKLFTEPIKADTSAMEAVIQAANKASRVMHLPFLVSNSGVFGNGKEMVINRTGGNLYVRFQVKEDSKINTNVLTLPDRGDNPYDGWLVEILAEKIGKAVYKPNFNHRICLDVREAVARSGGSRREARPRFCDILADLPSVRLSANGKYAVFPSVQRGEGSFFFIELSPHIDWKSLADAFENAKEEVRDERAPLGSGDQEDQRELPEGSLAT